jgi:putative transposase
MPFWRLYYHLVWATKNREPLIRPEIEARLYAYLVHKAAEQGVYVYAVNGYVDHVHVVAAIPPKHAVADVVKNLKGASSHDLNAGQGQEGQFAWQRGYGALSFGERQLPEAIRYVENQKEHHGQQTTNAWLERDAEFDEGPAQRGLAHTQAAATLREPAARYDSDDKLPF